VSSLTVNNGNTGAGTAVTVNLASAQTIGSLSGTVATPSSGTNTATINVTGTLTVNQTTNGVFPGTIAGAGGLTKSGPAMLTLTGINTYAGPTIINAGVLQSSAPGDNPQGALPAGQPVTVNAGGTLLLGADDGLGYYAGSVSSLTVNGGSVTSNAGTHSTLPAVTLNGGSITAGGVVMFRPVGR
jgi:autotransporter-associated beta strand protein